MTATDAPPPPPPSATHPLHLLESFLRSLPDDRGDRSDGGGDGGRRRLAYPEGNDRGDGDRGGGDGDRGGGDGDDGEERGEEDRDRRSLERRRAVLRRRADVLRAADFLYGGLLEGALAVLDDDGGGGGGDGDGESAGAAAAVAVRSVRAEPSGRTVVLVRGSGAGGHYVCLLGGEPPLRRRGRGGGPTLGAARRGARHCSCRSFFERSKSDRRAVCKHLLAAILAPHLGCPGYGEEVVPDADFAEVVMGRSLP